MSILQIPGMDKLRIELGEWVCSQSISSSGFMTKPADLQQQLYAQREIAIRELTINKSPPQTQPIDNNENEKFFDARSTPDKLVELESNSFPLMNSCLTAEFKIVCMIVCICGQYRNFGEKSQYWPKYKF